MEWREDQEICNDPFPREKTRMADDSSDGLMSAVQLAVNQMHSNDGHANEEKVLLVSNGANGPHIIAVNSDLVISELRDDSSSSEMKMNGLFNVSEEDICEPPRKKAKTSDSVMKSMLKKFYKSLEVRLDKIDKNLADFGTRCRQLELRVEPLANHLRDVGAAKKSGVIILGLPQAGGAVVGGCGGAGVCGGVGDGTEISLPQIISPNVTLITLNSEEDFPNGSWLGDEGNPDGRVRCNISPSDLANIERTCTTAQKMALTLLDYLFDRETQACSNISGLGKHGKKQLDPLLIYGIRCHLIHKFGTPEKDWNRIKQNVDSKCRTAYRRKQKGMPLTVKAFRDRWVLPAEQSRRQPTTFVQMVANGVLSEEPDLPVDQELDLSNGSASIPLAMACRPHSVSIALDELAEPQIIEMPGNFHVLHATPEQLAQFQQEGCIEIVTDGQLIDTTCSDDDSNRNDDLNNAVHLSGTSLLKVQLLKDLQPQSPSY